MHVLGNKIHGIFFNEENFLFVKKIHECAMDMGVYFFHAKKKYNVKKIRTRVHRTRLEICPFPIGFDSAESGRVCRKEEP